MNSDPTSSNNLVDDSVHSAQQVNNLRQIYGLIGDQLEDILANINLTLLDPAATLDPQTIACLSMVTAFQYAELLPDMLASDAMRSRTDWKYALHLPVHHQGFDPDTFCRFRQNLKSSQKGLDEFARLLERLGQIGLYARATRSQMTSDTVLTTVCQISRLHRLSVAMKSAMSLIVATAPDWVRANMPPYWFERYKTGRLVLPVRPTRENMTSEAEKFGADMLHLLAAFGEMDQALVAGLPEVEYLRKLFNNQFTVEDGQARWRQPGCEQCPVNDLKKINSNYSTGPN
jgi:hypothetical protein